VSDIIVTQMSSKMVQNRKFTDQQFMELYRQGLSDYEIAEKLGVHRETVQRRRQRKLGLPSNYLPGYCNPKRRRR